MIDETGYVMCTARGKCFHKALWINNGALWECYHMAACGTMNTAEYDAYVVLPGTSWASTRRPCKRCYPNGEVGRLG